MQKPQNSEENRRPTRKLIYMRKTTSSLPPPQDTISYSTSDRVIERHEEEGFATQSWKATEDTV